MPVSSPVSPVSSPVSPSSPVSSPVDPVIDAYATPQDIEDIWRTLTTTEKHRASKLLERAKLRLDVECPPSDPITDRELAVRKDVSCEMVKRVLNVSQDSVGIDSMSSQAGPFSGTYKFSNPNADLYLTKNDRKLLGCSRGRAFSVDLLAGRNE